MTLSKFYHSDARGSLSKINLSDLPDNFIPTESIISSTKVAFTARGLHQSLPPMAEQKLIACVSGSVIWVVIQQQNPDSYNVCSHLLTESDSKVLHVEKGLIHGCISLSDNTHIQILSDQSYSSSHSKYYSWNGIIDQIAKFYGLDLTHLSFLDMDSPDLPANSSTFSFSYS